jgi:hypothetical protein
VEVRSVQAQGLSEEDFDSHQQRHGSRQKIVEWRNKKWFLTNQKMGEFCAMLSTSGKMLPWLGPLSVYVEGLAFLQRHVAPPIRNHWGPSAGIGARFPLDSNTLSTPQPLLSASCIMPECFAGRPGHRVSSTGAERTPYTSKHDSSDRYLLTNEPHVLTSTNSAYSITKNAQSKPSCRQIAQLRTWRWNSCIGSVPSTERTNEARGGSYELPPGCQRSSVPYNLQLLR